MRDSIHQDKRPSTLRLATPPRRRRAVITALVLPFIAALMLSLLTIVVAMQPFLPLPPPAYAAAAPDTSSSVAPGEDVFLARSIEEYIVKRSEAQRQKVESISLKKMSGAIEDGVYRSTWNLSVKLRLGYVRPEKDPFLSGMIKCLAELKASSTPEWVDWAQKEIARYRKDIQNRMTIAQETDEQVTAVAEINAAGYIDANTIRLKAAGAAEALPVENLLGSIPDPAGSEVAGYNYLGSTGKTEPNTATGSTPTGQSPAPEQNPAGPTQGSSAPKSGSTQPSTTATSPVTRVPSSPKYASDYDGQSGHGQLMIWAVAILALLLTVLVVSEIHSNRRK